MYFVVKVTAGQEKIITSLLQNKFNLDPAQDIYSIMVIGNIRGYIIVEGESEIAVRLFVSGVQNVKGVLPDPVPQEEIDRLLSTKTTEQEIDIKDIIEFSSGPFKGYKAKVLKVDPIKAEVTVELMDVVVPIPITTKMDTIKIIQKEKKYT
ncbi:MAG: transcription elongation factor Spt5 [Candidatus Micrarchaeaceae archaeon]